MVLGAVGPEKENGVCGRQGVENERGGERMKGGGLCPLFLPGATSDSLAHDRCFVCFTFGVYFLALDSTSATIATT